jgi:zinc/manganese transport system substrate-binding protein
MRRVLTLSRSAAVGALAVLAVGCGSDGSESGTGTAASSGDVPTIVVTTDILGDVVGKVVGDLAEVEVVMPSGADPHDFAPSARQAESMENADLLVVNGAGFEEGMTDVIDNVASSGTPVFTFTDHVELLAFDGVDTHGEEPADQAPETDHSGDDHSGDDPSGDDPHFWTDPARMITAVVALGAEFGAVDGIDPAVVDAQMRSYVDELAALDAEMEESLSSVPDEQRVLVTNHEVFAYFADRFDFEVVGAVIPSLTTSAEPSTAEVEALADLVAEEQIPAIFADTSGSTRLAEAIAASAGSEVEIVLLFSESLGPPGSGAETYVAMMSTNASLIADALTPS